MKKYETYKNSGVEWIGDIPFNWKVAKLKYVTANVPYPIVDGPFGTQLKANEYQDSGVPLVRISNLDFKGNLTLKDIKFITEEKAGEIKRSAIQLNDIIIGKTGATIGKSGLNDKIPHGIVSSSCLKISVNQDELFPNYFKYYVTSDNFQEIILQTASGSTRDTINITPMANLEAILPSKEEQTQIAKYLDYKTQIIDALIDKKEQLIKKLQAQKQAIINEAVTKGLNKNANLKDSGIEWLGEIPEHWSVKKIKHEFDNLNKIRVPLSSSERGVMKNKIYDYYGASGVIDRVENYLFDGDNILIGEDGANLLTRSKRLAFIAKGQYWVNNHAHIIHPKTGNINYMAEMLELIDYTPLIVGAAQPKLTQDALVNISIPVPPVKEQDLIMKYLSQIIDKINQSTSLLFSQIQKLKSYRQSIISEAVTGKIDVRDWQAPKS